MSWWAHDAYQAGGIIALLSRVFWVIFSITLHELGHGWAALWQGDDTPRRFGRMTLNPVVHMGLPSLLVFALCGIAWGAMPVDPSRFRWGRRGRIVVSAAGPAVNLALALGCVLLAVAWLALGPRGSNVYGNLAGFLFTGGWLNFLLAAFNLMPFPPLDGANMLAGLSLRLYQLYHHPNAQLFGMAALLVIFFMTPIGSYMGAACYLAALILVDVPGAMLGSPPIHDLMLNP